MNLIVAKETAEGETRVALVPETVRKLSAVGLTVLVERGAGERASFPDDAFAAAGATIVASVAEGFARPAATSAPAAMLLRVRPPTPAEALVGAIDEVMLWRKALSNAEICAVAGIVCD